MMDITNIFKIFEKNNINNETLLEKFFKNNIGNFEKGNNFDYYLLDIYDDKEEKILEVNNTDFKDDLTEIEKFLKNIFEKEKRLLKEEVILDEILILYRIKKK